MSREILFKAKRRDNGEWVEGYLMDENYINVPFDDYDACGRFDDPIEIDPNTICQYTGLTDKNDNKIWENDIICCGMKLRVSWHHYHASWVLSKKGWMYNHFFGESIDPEDVEVVGNIFDNPELLNCDFKEKQL